MDTLVFEEHIIDSDPLLFSTLHWKKTNISSKQVLTYLS